MPIDYNIHVTVFSDQWKYVDWIWILVGVPLCFPQQLRVSMGTSGGVTVTYQTFSSWFGSHWLPYSYSRVPHQPPKSLVNYYLEFQCCALWLVGWILWHINNCRLFNAKFCLDILYIKYIYDLWVNRLQVTF